MSPRLDFKELERGGWKGLRRLTASHETKMGGVNKQAVSTTEVIACACTCACTCEGVPGQVTTRMGKAPPQLGYLGRGHR